MKYSFWHQVPVVKLLLPFAVGIGFSMFYPVGFLFPFFGFIVFFLFSFIVHKKLQQYGNRWIFGLFLSTSMIMGGIALHQFQNELHKPQHFKYYPLSTHIIVEASEQPIAKHASFKVICKALSVIDSAGNNKPAQGNLLLYFPKDIESKKVEYGSVFMLPYAQIKLVAPPQNPDEFNYKRYLAFNNIYYQLYIRNKIQFIDVKHGNSIQHWVYSVQAYVKNVLSRNIGSANETAVAQALLYGFDDDIDSETVKAYSNTGTLHVLAVSGMHVGIIYMILGFFLAPLVRIPRGKLLKAIIIFTSLWLYSLICGMSPSILRATVMFSFILIADVLNTKSNIYNTLATSAFTLLCINPNMLANVGFQLSYLAVLGIVFFQPLIYKWYLAPNYVTNQVWKITSVSLAAQLTTCPIGLLYFHQFPNCFLFSNLIIIPLTTLILYGGIVLIIISPLSWLSFILGKILYVVIAATNQIVIWVEKIPYAYVNGIHISIFQSITLCIIIISITAYFLIRRVVFLQLFLVCCILFLSEKALHQIQNKQQHRMLLYQINGITALHLIEGNNALLLADTTLLQQPDKIKFHLQQHIWRSGIAKQNVNYINNQWQYVKWGNHTVLITGKNTLHQRIQTEYLFINCNINMEEMMKKVSFQKAFITSAIKPTYAYTIMEYFKRKNISVTYTAESGAIEVLLP